VRHLETLPTYAPSLAEPTQLVGDFDLGVVAAFGRAIVEPSGHDGGSWLVADFMPSRLASRLQGHPVVVLVPVDFA